MAALVTTLTVMLGACADAGSGPSGPDEPFVVQAASAGSLITIEPRRINISCQVGQFCGIQVLVSSSAPVTLDWGLEGGGLLLASGQACPVASYFFGECTIDIVVDTSHPARYAGRLIVGNLDTGSYKNYRVSARVR